MPKQSKSEASETSAVSSAVDTGAAAMPQNELRQRRGAAKADAEPAAAAPAPASAAPKTAAPAEPPAPVVEVPKPALLVGSSGDGWLGLCRDDRIALLILTLLSFFTRYWRLDLPQGVVFDEYHFGRFTNQYHKKEYLFDIHPPLGKLVLYGVSLLVGYDHTVCKYDNIEDRYDDTCKYYWLRATSAFHGALTAPMMFLIVRNFGGSLRAAAFAALLFICDGLNITESRLVLIDAQLIFWCTAVLLLAQYWWTAYNAHCDALSELFESVAGRQLGFTEAMLGRTWGLDGSGGSGPGSVAEVALQALKVDPRYMGPGKRVAWAVAVGVTCCNSVSIKFTGLGAPGLVALEAFFSLWFTKRSYPLPDLLLILTVAFILYSLYFKAHFVLGQNTADGDAFMPVEFQKNIKGNANYDPEAPVLTEQWSTYFQVMLGLNKEMVTGSNGITQRHNWETYWWEWPVNLRGLLYYSHDVGHTYTQAIYLLGVPTVIWPVFAFLVLSVLFIVGYLRLRSWQGLQLHRYSQLATVLGFCLVAYAVNMLPYLAVARSCFIYHYMPALMYGHMIAALLLDKLAGKRYMPAVFKLSAAVVLAGFLYYVPWIYGLPLTSEGHARRRWLPRWD